MATFTWAFLLDVDNTLIDNDAVKADLDRTLRHEYGPEVAQEFWTFYDEVRHELDRVDFPEVLRRFCAGAVPAEVAEGMSAIVNAIPFERYRYPEVLQALAHLATLGTTVIVSDGDSVFQPAKIRRAGITAAVAGRVVITTHKEKELPTVYAAYPADRYVMIDDKPGILEAVRQREPQRFRTILVAQGHYGQQPSAPGAADLTVARIGDLRTLTLDQLR
ncbi:MAG TPA: haloacid dehalogenase-like hydrolase [Chloroflexota bacterium]|jgi:FMN phosphatase YigB (HAD superfamily)|nr:haloacid dehalogenase-like hydrolase [Chloroflexota bacterium]